MATLQTGHIDSTFFTEKEIQEIQSILSQRYGAKQKVISFSGVTNPTFYRAMRGGFISQDTKDRLVNAIEQIFPNQKANV